MNVAVELVIESCLIPEGRGRRQVAPLDAFTFIATPPPPPQHMATRPRSTVVFLLFARDCSSAKPVFSIPPLFFLFFFTRLCFTLFDTLHHSRIRPSVFIIPLHPLTPFSSVTVCSNTSPFFPLFSTATLPCLCLFPPSFSLPVVFSPLLFSCFQLTSSISIFLSYPRCPHPHLNLGSSAATANLLLDLLPDTLPSLHLVSYHIPTRVGLILSLVKSLISFLQLPCCLRKLHNHITPLFFFLFFPSLPLLSPVSTLLHQVSASAFASESALSNHIHQSLSTAFIGCRCSFFA